MAAGASKTTSPEKTSSSSRAVTNKKPGPSLTGAGAIKKTPEASVAKTPGGRAPVTRSGSISRAGVTRTPSMTRGETSSGGNNNNNNNNNNTRTRTPSMNRGETSSSGLPRTRAPSVTRTDSSVSVSSRTRAPSVTRTPSVSRSISSSSGISVNSSKGTKAVTTRSSSKNILESAKTKPADIKRQDKETTGSLTGAACPGPVTSELGESSSNVSRPQPGPGADNTEDKNTEISTPVKSSDTTKITTAEIVPTPVAEGEPAVSLFSTEKTIEFERKTFSSSTLPRKVSNTSNVSETMVEVQRSVPDTQADEVQIEEVEEVEYKAEAVIFRKDSASVDRKESVGDIIRKISELNEVIVKEEDSSVSEDDPEKSVTKVAEENNDSIVRSEEDDNDDNDDDEAEDIDNDSVEDDVQIIQMTQYANKSRKESATSSSVIKTDTTNNSNRKYSQKFINPFEPPVPELVNKSALIAEFNSVQEENLKKTSFKSMIEESLEGSKEQYFTSQALNNATSTTINQVRSSFLYNCSFCKIFLAQPCIYDLFFT